MSEVSQHQFVPNIPDDGSASLAQSRALSGGVTRVEAIVPGSEPEMDAQSLARPATGTFRYAAGTDTVENTATARLSTGDLPRAHATGILATAINPWGSPAMRLKPDTLVDVGGQMAPLCVAEQMGLVRRNEIGQYVETTAADQADQQAQQPESRNEFEQELFAPDEEAALAELVRDVPPEMLGAAVIPLAIRAAETGDLDLNVEDLVSKTGMDPARAERFLDRTLAAFQGQADSALQSLQVDPQHFYEWARLHHPERLVHAAVSHIRARSLGGYRELAQDYLRKTTPDISGLAAAGYETKVDATTKQPMVKVRGMWVTVKAAAREGLI